MMRVLLCLNCCSASARAAKPPVRKLSDMSTKVNNGNIADPSNFKSLKVFGTDVSKDEPDPMTVTTRNSLGDIQSVLDGMKRVSRQDLASTHVYDSEEKEMRSQSVPEEQRAGGKPDFQADLTSDEETKSQQNSAHKCIQDVGSNNNRSNSPSTTRIGDYARIEYSPVAHSQSSSPASGRQFLQTNTDAVSNIQRDQDKVTDDGLPQPARLERRHGFESSSISIASQLSSEMEKNLTNMLESANSPVPMFGTIGLPLGPMVSGGGGTTTSSSRAEPALTSGSQESLSDRPKSQATSAGFGDSGAMSGGGGAALTAAESAEESEQLQQEQVSKRNLETSITSKMQDVSVDGGRVSSSMNSTISTSLTNPTPTPSELSGTSSTKRRKLSAKGLLKKLKPGKSKKRTSSPATLAKSNDDANKQK